MAVTAPGQGEGHRRKPARQGRHRFARSPGRAAHRAHQRSHRPLQDERQGPSFAARSAAHGVAPAQAARLSQVAQRRQLPRADRQARPAQIARAPVGPCIASRARTLWSFRPQDPRPRFVASSRGLCAFMDPQQCLTAIKKSIHFGQHTLTLETGEIARQAGGAVLASLDDTVVLVTVRRRQEREGRARTSSR